MKFGQIGSPICGGKRRQERPHTSLNSAAGRQGKAESKTTGCNRFLFCGWFVRLFVSNIKRFSVFTLKSNGKEIKWQVGCGVAWL